MNVSRRKGRVFEPRFWAQNRALFSARLCRDWRRDFAAIGGAISPRSETGQPQNAGSHSCRSLHATARPSALHPAVLTLPLTPELEVSRAGRRSPWSAAWICGCTACASAATATKGRPRGACLRVTRASERGLNTNSMAMQKTTRCICSN